MRCSSNLGIFLAFAALQTLIQGLPLALIANFSELRLTSFRSSALLSWSKDTLREYFVEHSEGRGLYGDGPLGWDWQDLIEGSTAPKALSKERKVSATPLLVAAHAPMHHLPLSHPIFIACL